MKFEMFIDRQRVGTWIANACLPALVLLIFLESGKGSELAEVKAKASSDPAKQGGIGSLAHESASSETWFSLEAKAHSGAKLKDGEILALGRLLREQMRWGDAAKWYATWLERAASSELKDKVSKELVYCERMANGWMPPPAKDSYTANLRSLEMVFPLTPPKLMEETLMKLELQFPEHWELLVFRARNFVSLGRLSDAEAALAKAVRLGGESTQASTQALREDINRRQALNATGKQAAALLKFGKKKDAAILLGKAWEKFPDAVEFALKSCQLRVETRDFEAADVLNGKLRNYLAEHPAHPMAGSGALLAVAAEKSAEAEKLRDKIAAPAKKAAVTNQSPAKSGGSMADKFRKRTQ